MEFSIYRMKQVLKGETDKRISEAAAEALGEEMDEIGLQISQKAIEIAQDKGRKTVRGEDIQEAIRQD